MNMNNISIVHPIENHNFESDSRVLIPFIQYQKYGFMNKSKEVVVKPAYDFVLGEFHHEWSLVRVGVLSSNAYLGTGGKIISHPRKLFGVLDASGELIVSCEYMGVQISDDFEYITLHHPVLGYSLIDRHGNTIIPYGVYNYMDGADHGLVRVYVVDKETHEKKSAGAVHKMNADLSDLGPGYEIARDIFMVGVWTAQRVSDYNNISKKDINTYTRKYIVEEEDPNTKEKIEKVVREEVTYINIRQQKTGTKVAIPCSTELKMILEKYDYQMPHLEDQVINRYIKEVAKKAGICQLVEIETTKGGTPAKTRIEKHQLIHTHTARRTGATLMYLSGMDVYDIMKITGHSSPAMLKKYIKADQLQVVEKIMSKYNYFN